MSSSDAQATGATGEATDDPTAGPARGAVTTGTVETNGIETYYERRGEGPPVVFVHGAVMDHGMWAAQCEALAADHTVVAYDVRGHGRTGGSDVDPYTVDLFADDLDALLTALDLDRPVLVALSLGGAVAGVYAARHPDRVAGLVLADTFTPERVDWRDNLQYAALEAAVLPVRLVGYPRVQRAMTWVHERLTPGAGGDYDAVERLQAEMPPMATDEFAKVIRALANFDEVDVDLSRIDAPTLVLYGEHETGLVRRQVPLLAGTIPGAEVRVVPDAGHASNVDNPSFFTDAVRDLLVRVADSGGE